MRKTIVLFFLTCLSPAAIRAQDNPNLKLTLKGHEGSVNALCFSPDGKTLVSGGDDKTIRCWDIATGTPGAILTGHFAGVHFLRYSPDGSMLVSAGDRSLRTWTPCGAVRKTFTGPVTNIWSFDISADGQFIAAGSYEKKYRVWNLASARQSALVDGHEQSVLAVRYSPTDTLLATGSLDRTIRLWGAKSYSQLKEFTGHSDNIYALCFTPDGRYLASASRDKTARLWNVASGKIVKSFIGHEKGLTTLDISPDGLFLLTGGVDNLIKLWELPTGRCLFTFFGHQGQINCVRFSPDGKTIASASADGTIIIWYLSPNVFVESYFENDILDELNASPLFAPKAKDETKTGYKARQDSALKYSQQVYENYYKKYLLQLQRNIE